MSVLIGDKIRPLLRDMDITISKTAWDRRERGFAICDDDTKFVRGRMCIGGECAIRLPPRMTEEGEALTPPCPEGTRHIGWFHTHPGRSTEPSAMDVVSQIIYQGLNLMCIGAEVRFPDVATRVVNCYTFHREKSQFVNFEYQMKDLMGDTPYGPFRYDHMDLILDREILPAALDTGAIDVERYGIRQPLVPQKRREWGGVEDTLESLEWEGRRVVEDEGGEFISVEIIGSAKHLTSMEHLPKDFDVLVKVKSVAPLVGKSYSAKLHGRFVDVFVEDEAGNKLIPVGVSPQMTEWRKVD